jgi:hypothetical protein
MTTENQPGLYDRLGGVYGIATVVDDFIDRIMVDPRLNANPRVDEAHHKVSPPGFKYLVTEMVCWATGGPQQYTGRSMRDSHQHLLITAATVLLRKLSPPCFFLLILFGRSRTTPSNNLQSIRGGGSCISWVFSAAVGRSVCTVSAFSSRQETFVSLARLKPRNR